MSTKMNYKKNYLFCFLLWSFKIIFFSSSFYLLIVLVGGYFWTLNPKQTNLQAENAKDKTETVEIYITSNGLHTDVVIPIKSKSETSFFNILAKDSVLNFYLGKTSSYKWLSIGWGNKGFYNESYSGNFPSFPTCLNAALLPSETLMHLDFYRNKLIEDKNCKKIKLKKQEYQQLVQHIMASFRTVNEDLDNQIKFVRLPQKGYSSSDYFFEANNSYHLFYTCNSWTNEALQKANQKTARFAPFAQTIMYQLD